MSRLIDLCGQRFGRLHVCHRASQSDRGRAVWVCFCDCGRSVHVAGHKLRSGHTQSCGCLQTEHSTRMGRSNRVHGHGSPGRHTPTYESWCAMRRRCNNHNAWEYGRYGGRGIDVCNRWDSFEKFLTDMGERPEGTTLDRYPDNDGNYEPGNCRWATPKQQAWHRNMASA